MKSSIKRPTARGRRHLNVRAPLIGVVAVSLLAACSSGGNDGNSGGSGGGGGAFVSESQTLLDEATSGTLTGPAAGTVATDQLVPWKAEDMPAAEKLPSGSVKVAVVYAFPVGSPVYAGHMIEAIGKELGWDVNVFPASTPTPQGAAAAMQQALLAKPQAIIVAATPGPWVSQQLDQAKAAGIKTVSIHGNSQSSPGFDAYTPAAEGVQKSLLGAYIVAKSDGSSKTLLMSAPGFDDAEVPAAAAFLKGCSDCSTEDIQYNPDVFTDPTKLQSSVQATLAANPDTDYILWPQGSAPMQGALNAIGTSQARDAKLIANTAGPQSVQLLKDGQIPVVVNVPEAMMNIVAMDQVMRLVQGDAPLAEDAARYPVAVWTKDNAPDAADYASITKAQLSAADWLSPFAKAWGVDNLKDLVVGVSE